MRAAICVCILLAGLAAASALAQDVTLPEFERVELDNGAVLILTHKPDVPMVSVTAMIRGGAVADPDGLNGLAALFAALLDKGAGDRNAAEFAETVDSSGGYLAAAANLEDITISGQFLARDAGLMVELLGDMLMRPALDADELDKLRGRSINFILAAKDTNLNALLSVYGRAFLFGEHPYGNPVDGSETTLTSITHADLVDYYEQQVGADRLIVSVAGDFDAAAMRAQLEETFGNWRAAAGELPEVESLPAGTGRRVLLIDKPGATQTYFWIANIGVSRNFEQRASLDLANTVFGGRFTSMLNTALRVDSGLTYGAGSRLLRPARPGSVEIISYTRTEATVEALDIALAVLERLRDGGIDEDMLQSARNYILGQFPPTVETAAQVAGQLAALEAYALDIGYINHYGTELMAATTESVAAVIDSVYPEAEDVVLLLLGDAEQIREAATQYGPVTEMAITEPSFRVPPAAAE
jgi:predicted Zn-dependent peptidase